MSQFTPEQEKEFEFRLRYEQEQAAKQKPQTEAAAPKDDAASQSVNQIMMGGAGATVGAALKGLPERFGNMVKDPVTGQWMALENYGRQMFGGNWYGGKNMSDVYQRGYKVTGDPLKGIQPDPKLAAQYEAEALKGLTKGQQIAAKTPGPLKPLLTAPMGMLGRSAVGLGAGLQGSDAFNRYNAGDTSGAVISGLGALGTAASMIPHPVTRIGGTAIGLGAEGLNTFLDYLKKKSQKPAQPQQPQQMAEGGSAKNKMSKAERAAKAIRENNKKKVPHLSNGGLPPAENAARTQIIGTLPTYEKAEEELKKRGAQGRALDFGAGLGEGAKILKADTYEPFPKGWKPTFIDPKQIPTEAYGKLTNLNVMNVVPPKVRDEIASHIGRVIEPGGQGIVTTRGADVMKAKGRPGPEPMSIITSRDTYQKGFTKQELEDYMKRMLGEKYDVNKVNLGPAGVHVQKKKPTIYTGGGIAIPVNAPVGSRAQETTGQGAAQILNPLNLNFKEGGQVKHYFMGGSVPGTGPTIGAATTQTDVKTAPYNPNAALPANYQDARNAFQQQQEAQNANNPLGRIGLTVTGNDQFGQQFGYAADADAFNQFYNQNYRTPVAPLPGFAPGMDPVKPNKMPATLAEWQAQQGPVMTADVKPWAGTVDASGTWKANTPEEAAAAYAKFAAESNAATPIGITPPSGGGSGLSGLIAPTLPVPMPQQQPYMPMMGNNLTPPPIYNNPNFVPTQIGGNLPSGGSGLNSLVNQPTNAPKPVASITQQQPFQQRRVAPPLSGNINPSFAKRPLPYTPKPIPKPMPRRRMFAEGGSTTPAWQRSEGKSPSGGLNALGRASYKRETGGTLKAPQPEGGSRKKSFCARMGGMKKKLTSSKTANDPDSRINKALRKWKC